MTAYLTILSFTGDGKEIGTYKYLVTLETGQEFIGSFIPSSPRSSTVFSDIKTKAVEEVRNLYNIVIRSTDFVNLNDPTPTTIN